MALSASEERLHGNPLGGVGGSGVAFYLLTSAATAYAECAWVLWEHTGTSEKRNTLPEPVRAYETRTACERTLATVLASFKKNVIFGETVNVDNELQDAYVMRKNKDGAFVTTFFHYVCLPDTVDPRGPKAK